MAHMVTMVNDRGRITVGVTDIGNAALAKLMTTNLFAAEMDAYKVAIALALRAGLSSDQPLSGVKTKFNIGSLDPDGSLVELVRLLDSSGVGDPVARAERLADSGLAMLASRLVDSEQLLTEALGIVEADRADSA